MDKYRWVKFSIISAVAAAMAWPCSVRAEIGIVSPETAASWIESAHGQNHEFVVLDTRGGYKDYFRGHLPMAQHLEFDTLRGTENGVPVQYLPPKLTEPLLRRAGVHKNKKHILYATGSTLPNDEILSATMVAYVLEKYGVEDIWIVNGGLRMWSDLGLPVTQSYHANPVGSLPRRRNEKIGASIIDIQSAMQDESTLILDARPENEYRGEDDVWLRKGHIPTALSFPWAKLMASENTHQFLPVEEVLPLLQAQGITPDKSIICYCGTSREGSLLRFYLKHLAHYPNVKLYEGAWKEYIWIQNQSLPAHTGIRP